MPSSFLYLLFTAKTWTRNKGRTDETAAAATCSLPFHFPAVSLSISPRQSPSAAVVRRRWRPIQFASRDESSILTERRMDGSQWEEDWEERRQKGWTDGVSKREGEGVYLQPPLLNNASGINIVEDNGHMTLFTCFHLHHNFKID